MATPGKIYLIPTPISDADPKKVLPADLLDKLPDIDTFFVENIRTSRRFLSKAGITDIQELKFEVLNKDTDPQTVENMLKIVKDGKDVGIMSEAGCPGIADPGSVLTLLAHKYTIDIVPFTGPSSIFLALMASGFNGQNFQFHGYLPVDKDARKRALLNLEKLVYTRNQTQIFMETPYRNNQVLATMLHTLREDSLLCVAANISAEKESIRTKTIREWRQKTPDLHKQPVIFLLYKK